MFDSYNRINKKYLLSISLVCMLVNNVGHAAIIILDFEGAGDRAILNEFYNGGTDSAGNSGVNYGVSFNSTLLALIDNDAGGTGNIGNEPTPDTALFFFSEAAAIMNVESGFDTGFSFFYSSVDSGGDVNVYDDINGTGNILATLSLASLGAGPGDPRGSFSNWDSIGVAFSGIAKSVNFGGFGNQIIFDNVTIGSDTAIVPVPAAIWLFCSGLIGLLGVRKKSTKLSGNYA